MPWDESWIAIKGILYYRIMTSEVPQPAETDKLAAARKRNLDLAIAQIQKDFGDSA